MEFTEASEQEITLDVTEKGARFIKLATTGENRKFKFNGTLFVDDVEVPEKLLVRLK